MSEQERFDREFVGIVLADYWNTHVRPLLRAVQPYLNALREAE